ncbi:MAG TPA: SHOCT domain-containing protein [Pseudogracilibacillus sp.]|nr:SHOCT domain-containing protein [Pseudogracilibacillus sp.]
MHHRMRDPNSPDMYDFLGGYSPIWMILFWVILIIFLIYLITQFIHKRKTVEQPYQMPLFILQERLARGDINEDEYNHLKSLIEKDQISK